MSDFIQQMHFKPIKFFVCYKCFKYFIHLLKITLYKKDSVGYKKETDSERQKKMQEEILKLLIYTGDKFYENMKNGIRVEKTHSTYIISFQKRIFCHTMCVKMQQPLKLLLFVVLMCIISEGSMAKKQSVQGRGKKNFISFNY